MMCITSFRMAWLRDVRRRGYDSVVWADALYEIEEGDQDEPKP